jgi:hypothetical protein
VPTKEHLLNQVSIIAERRRSEPGENHPLRKLHMQCKVCGKPIMVFQKNLKATGNCCRKCWAKDPEYKKNHMDGINKRSENPEWQQIQIDRNRRTAQSPEWKQAVLDGCKEREKDPEYRKRVSAGLQGVSIDEWKCFTKYAPYCEKFNNEFKERVRAFQGYRCALCGHVWMPGEKALSVHHVHYQKDSCCNDDAPKLFVPVCSDGCHQKTNRKREQYIEFFTGYLLEKFDGKCYYTKEEMAALKSTPPLPISA